VKKRYFIIIFALSIGLASCLNWVIEKPSLIIREITIRPHSFTEINLLIGLDIRNPNRFDLTLKSFKYTIYLNNEEFGQRSLENELLLHSLSVTQAQLPLVAKLQKLGNLKAIITGQDLPYKIEGTADVKTAIGHSNFTFSQEGNVNLRKLITP
jgi:LEA14-like dessication related protein